MENLQRAMTRVQLLFIGTLCSILIVLLSTAGCSDPSSAGSIASNIGSTLTSSGGDDYITSNRGGRYCIHNDMDSACIDLIPHVNDKIDSNGPVIHIYPERTQYLFYYEGKPIIRIEKPGDTTDIIEIITDPDPNPPKEGPSTPRDDDDDDENDDDGDDNPTNGDPTNDDPTNDNPTNDDPTNDDPTNNNPTNDDPKNDDPTSSGDDGHGWLIWVYYPEGKAPINPPSLSKSNVVVTINSIQLTDDDITGFAQFIGPDGQRGIQFFYPTDSAELLDLKVQMDGIVDEEGNVRFNINYLWYSY
ncbi:hypothetical protein F4083_02115 [Candidatus Poribacteria bacterium]|nr:hypothetical protein [Candidatus Poribacteria bacterium]MYI93107.1 hypothetical protein [Candidatus Poribacteria bacterium]